MWEVPPMSCQEKEVMDTSDNDGVAVSLGQCFCDADLCGRYYTAWGVLSACAFVRVCEEIERSSEPSED